MAAQFLLAVASVFFKADLRLNATPHAVAAGVAAGAFASFFPLGLHLAIAAVLCWVIAGNLVAAALADVAIGNPLTFPLLSGASWKMGKIILRDRLPSHGPPAHLSEMLHSLSFSQLWGPVLKPMLIGAVPLGLVSGLLFYGIARWGMTAYRQQRRKRLADKASPLL